MNKIKGHFCSPSVQPVQPVPPVPSNKTFSRFQKGEFPSVNFLMGRTDGNQKCPLIFFKLCGYLELVYIYLYTK